VRKRKKKNIHILTNKTHGNSDLLNNNSDNNSNVTSRNETLGRIYIFLILQLVIKVILNLTSYFMLILMIVLIEIPIKYQRIIIISISLY
jgi:hypothetical protein